MRLACARAGGLECKPGAGARWDIHAPPTSLAYVSACFNDNDPPRHIPCWCARVRARAPRGLLRERRWNWQWTSRPGGRAATLKEGHVPLKDRRTQPALQPASRRRRPPTRNIKARHTETQAASMSTAFQIVIGCIQRKKLHHGGAELFALLHRLLVFLVELVRDEMERHVHVLLLRGRGLEEVKPLILCQRSTLLSRHHRGRVRLVAPQIDFVRDQHTRQRRRVLRALRLDLGQPGQHMVE
mmetsp:Transcript_22444/g.57726  ORF Transcript_22444/g.57726 Transcript_22444/m.57726 type:complete len:242 (-) Transcript_22444:508-1233(-)